MLDERVGDLEAVVKELEEWTGELGIYSGGVKGIIY